MHQRCGAHVYTHHVIIYIQRTSRFIVNGIASLDGYSFRHQGTHIGWSTERLMKNQWRG